VASRRFSTRKRKTKKSRSWLAGKLTGTNDLFSHQRVCLCKLRGDWGGEKERHVPGEFDETVGKGGSVVVRGPAVGMVRPIK